MLLDAWWASVSLIIIIMFYFWVFIKYAYSILYAYFRNKEVSYHRYKSIPSGATTMGLEVNTANRDIDERSHCAGIGK